MVLFGHLKKEKSWEMRRKNIKKSQRQRRRMSQQTRGRRSHRSRKRRSQNRRMSYFCTRSQRAVRSQKEGWRS